MSMTDIFDDWESERELAPEGAPVELVHLALTCNGSWGLGIRDAIAGRNAMRECGDEPPVTDSAWKHELEMVAKLHGYDAYEMARRIAWRAYAQGLAHGELLERERHFPHK